MRFNTLTHGDTHQQTQPHRNLKHPRKDHRFHQQHGHIGRQQGKNCFIHHIDVLDFSHHVTIVNHIGIIFVITRDNVKREEGKGKYHC